MRGHEANQQQAWTCMDMRPISSKPAPKAEAEAEANQQQAWAWRGHEANQQQVRIVIRQE
eukprot:1141756-Pelagomonas_calceolata.AAC.3